MRNSEDYSDLLNHLFFLSDKLSNSLQIFDTPAADPHMAEILGLMEEISDVSFRLRLKVNRKNPTTRHGRSRNVA